MPREFIANIDDANQEIVCLDSALATATAGLTTATTEATASKEALATANTALTAAQTENAQLKADKTALQTSLDGTRADLQAANQRVVNVAANAGVPAVADVVQEKSKKTELKGAARTAAAFATMQPHQGVK